MPLLTRKQPSARPVKVLQFGEGNFLRAFIDWMIQRMNEQGGLDAQVQIVQPRRPNGNAERINAQGGLYTLIQRGMADGKQVEETTLIDVVNGCLNPYAEWRQVVATACLPTLRFIFSNTTEAGIEYKKEAYLPGQAPETFPAKLTSLLFERFQAFGGADDKGMLIFPCELIENNGSVLKDCVHRYAEDWGLPQPFFQWLDSACSFFNTLVDRIVAGFPTDEADAYERKLGYADKLMVCCEPFHFLAIEGPAKLATELPFEKAGLNVVVTDRLEPYRTRKVRFLNGAHTSSVPAAILCGLTTVDEMMADSEMRRFIEHALFQEIFPTIALPESEKQFYAESVLERFRNPFAKHRLLSIALNSISKWKVRVLPTLKDYRAQKKELPKCLAFSLAALLRFYLQEDKMGNAGEFTYPISDSPEILQFFAEETALFKRFCDLNALVIRTLGNQALWGEDLNAIPDLSLTIALHLDDILQHGIRAALKRLLD